MTPSADLIVIIGAGASKDCHVPTLTTFNNHVWQPPLTNEIFSPRPNFQQILNRFPKTHGAVARYLTGGTPSQTIEEYLKELSELKDLLSRQQARFIALYLNELFTKVSRLYLTDNRSPVPNAYTTLIQHLYLCQQKSQIRSVSFLTTNYDFILERALEAQFSTRFNSEDTYCGFHPEWSLIKFHGSANWWYEYKPAHMITAEPAITRIFRAIETDQLGQVRENSKIRVIEDISQVHQIITDPIFFPAIALPIDGKYGALCPQNHLTHLKNILSRKPLIMLIIGFSAKDLDVLEFINPHSNAVQRLCIVNGTKQDGCTALGRLGNLGCMFPAEQAVWNSGFSDFVSNPKGLRSFLS